MKLFVLVGSLLFSIQLLAQGQCATNEKTARAAELNPQYQAGLEELQTLSTRFEAGLVDEAQRDGVKQIDIPVVFHVLYREEEADVSYEQILSQIDVLNRDFNWENADKDKIPSVWQGLGRPTGFRFHLADKDPDGNPTMGITRKQTTIPQIGDSDYYYQDALGGTDPWPQPHYLNIWVCEINNSILGFSILPSSHMAPNDGIVIHYRAFGTMGTAEPPYTGGRTLVHEAGHYFGLRHVWGDDENSCTSTDYMSDTPWQRGPNYECETFPHVSCESEPNGDMFMNYMDYADDTCMLLFTERQVAFMQLVIRTSRVTLLHSEGYTGVDDRSGSGFFRLYPNPASDVVHLGFETGEMPEEVCLYDALGNLLKTTPALSREVVMDLSGLQKGVYFIVTSMGSKRIILQ